ncbi:TonB-dependent receptor [Methylophilus sp. Leaf408]|uniref:TonB-dependent receptor n=1 Tax=Methylophilus sp. Leaf408 TaxID=2876561 RepID=UPI001E416B73|nr:TonB-dependent receptor [Methylophilus sp. Leaf408]
MKKKFLFSVIATLLTTPAFAEDLQLDDVTVKSSGFERKDTETTYASEIHTSDQIQASGASNLYDFLAQYSSLNILSGFGNKAAPLINMRGYGNENGYQNVVVSVDGQRLNNIDMSPQLIGAIPLSNIERIEISKGSGSVIYGDGATAGSIQIYTKAKTGISVAGSLGNYGQKSGYVSGGISSKYISLSASASDESYDGFSKKDIFGKRDEFDNTSQNVKLTIKPIDKLRLKANATSARISTFYVGPITKAEFNENPRQNSGNAYTFQRYEMDQWRAGIEYDINENLMISIAHDHQRKTSFFDAPQPPFPFSQLRTYDYKNDELLLKYAAENLKVMAGIQNFDGTMERISDKSSKNNLGFFTQAEYELDNLTLSAGARHERVNYRLQSFGSPSINKEHNLEAFDVGANYKFGQELSLFSNLNYAFQAPDIDRFFNFGSGFNPDVVPTKSRTFNIGFNHVTQTNRFKASGFYSSLSNEIFYNPTMGGLGTNTNIDQSHKYGVEIQDQLKLNEELSTGVIYTFTRAIIDSDNDGSVLIKDKNLPGVPKHTVIANINYQLFNNATLNLNHTWRAKAYAFNDLQNNFDQKQNRYESTNLTLSYQYKNLNVYTAVNNIFEHENSIQVQDNTVYPIDFARTWRVGLKADF